MENYPLVKAGYDLKNPALSLILSKNAQRAVMPGEKNISLRCVYQVVYVSVCVNVSIWKHLIF